MRSNRVVFLETIGDEYKCWICKNLSIEAHRAPCGCRFCLECIKSYLKKENTCCPGTRESCKELSIEKGNVLFDEEANENISKFVVRCSAKHCEFQDFLIQMEDHTRDCRGTERRCRYFNMGCNKVLDKDEELDHVIGDNNFHTKLIKDFMEHMKKDMELTKMENRYLNFDLKSKHVRQISDSF